MTASAVMYAPKTMEAGRAATNVFRRLESSAYESVALREPVRRRECHDPAWPYRVPLGEDRIALEEVLDVDRDVVLALEVGHGEQGILVGRTVHKVEHLQGLANAHGRRVPHGQGA